MASDSNTSATVTTETVRQNKYLHNFMYGHYNAASPYAISADFVPDRSDPKLSVLASDVVAYSFYDYRTIMVDGVKKKLGPANESGWTYPDAEILTGGVVKDRLGNYHQLQDGDRVIDTQGTVTEYNSQRASRNR